ncbi:MAG: hypothetical protein MHPSP_000235 [Paramarteilia canceri]
MTQKNDTVASKASRKVRQRSSKIPNYLQGKSELQMQKVLDDHRRCEKVRYSRMMNYIEHIGQIIPRNFASSSNKKITQILLNFTVYIAFLESIIKRCLNCTFDFFITEKSHSECKY